MGCIQSSTSRRSTPIQTPAANTPIATPGNQSPLQHGSPYAGPGPGRGRTSTAGSMAPRSPLHATETTTRNAARTLRRQQEAVALLLEHAIQYPDHGGMKSAVAACERLSAKIQSYLVGTGRAVGPDDVSRKLQRLTRIVNEHRAEVVGAMVARDESSPAQSPVRPHYNPADFEASTVFPAGNLEYGAYGR